MTGTSFITIVIIIIIIIIINLYESWSPLYCNKYSGGDVHYIVIPTPPPKGTSSVNRGCEYRRLSPRSSPLDARKDGCIDHFGIVFNNRKTLVLIVRVNLVFWETAHLPLPFLNGRVSNGLGEGRWAVSQNPKLIP